MDKKTENCWDFMKCESKEDCAVYKLEMGRECWFLMNNKKGCPASKKYGSCFKCPFYKKLNPND